MLRANQSVSLARIAAEAGVSRATVSMALRNQPRIPAGTRERIQDLARRMGWKPNPLLSEVMTVLRAGQPAADQVTLAWVTAYPKRDAWRRVPFFRRCFAGAQERAAAAGYRLEHFWLGDAEGNAARLGAILTARGIHGLVIAPLPRPEMLELSWTEFAAVTVAYTLREPMLHRATDNHCASARLATASLRRAGCRRIGLAIPEDYQQRVNGLWTAGYLVETQQAGVVDTALLHLPPELRESSLVEWVQRNRIDGIVGTDLRIPGWLRRAGMRIPEEVAYADLDLPAADGSASGILQDAGQIGACAIDLLAGQLMRHERGIPEHPKILMIEGRWCDGATAPRLQSNAAPATQPSRRPASPAPVAVPFD